MEVQDEYMLGTVKHIKNPSSGLFYAEGTKEEVIKAIEKAKTNDWRVTLDYGNIETGESWGDVNDITGYVGNSTGPCKTPLLLYNKRSRSGRSILADCILSIRRTGKNGEYLYKWSKA